MADEADIFAQIAELTTLAVGLFEAGKLGDAENILSSLVQIVPGDAAVLKYLGIIHATRGQYGQAIQYLADLSGDAVAFNVLSVCCFQIGRHADALAAADHAIALRPGFHEAHNSRGNALNRLERHREAIAAFNTSLRLQPRDPIVMINLANVWRDLKQPAEALEVLDQALAIDGSIPDAHGNRGNVLHDLGRHDEAIGSYDRAIALDPRRAEPHQQKGNLLVDLGRYADAIGSFDAALAIDPDLARVHLTRSHCNLTLGNFAEGWREYEWRWQGSPVPAPRQAFTAPLWLGEESLEGRSILLHCEQGQGDCIQFVRYATTLAERGARVLVQAYEPLAELFRSVAGVEGVVVRGEPAPLTDFQCPLLSLPLALGGATQTRTPYLSASPALVAAWRARLPGHGGRRIGLTASGNAAHKNDHNRSLPLAALAGSLPAGPRYVLLQKDLRNADRAVVENRADITFLGDQIGGFQDTAAICESLDLVISVDTSVAHLAGALDRPTWILLPTHPDWRWGLETRTTPWYPSATLYRQDRRGDWSSVLERLAGDLGRRVFD